ncbi:MULTISPECIES: hypothetical protein [Streptomyces]|uniref:hypothetical protein n=1 Tax=Streptomyces TaxID=1883 RepID=UPI000B9E88F7|nr:hypothetical protein [Streptomyces kasugaensis]
MRHDDTRREVVAEPARPVDDGTTVSLLDRLHDSFVNDEDLDDDLDLILSLESALLTAKDAERLTPQPLQDGRAGIRVRLPSRAGTPGSKTARPYG